MTPGRTPVILLILIAGACAGPPLAREPTLRRLRIENPRGRVVELERVGGDRILVGDATRIDLDLEADRYVVRSGEMAWPAPLLPGARSEGEVLVVRLDDRPAPPAGFVLVPAGPALVGDLLGVGAPDERPARVVEVGAFLLAEAETSNAEYAAFLNDLGRCAEDWLDLGGPKCRIARADDGGFTTDAPDLPVVTVTQPGATAYCDWLTARTGVRHRLPTEVEWEKAARGPTSSTYAYGDVYDPKAANQESGFLRPVRSYPATGWGAHDLTGNAFEWTGSDYAAGKAVLKGGSYVLDGLYLRNSFRMWYRPLVQADDIGFRVLREISP